MEKSTLMTSNEMKEREWSNLPCDVLSLIQSHLFGRDYVRFNAVCREWRLVPPPIRPIPHPSTTSEITQYPSLLYFNGQNSLFNVFNPIYNSTSTIDIHELIGTRICFSKDGWLLMSRGLQVFFFQPFTKQRIDLPNLTMAHEHKFNKMSFSSPPTSSDCVVCGIVDFYPKAVEISFIFRGEDSWTSIYRKTERDFYWSNSNPVFYNGAFYCLGCDGTLGILDPMEKGKRRWRLLDKLKQPCKSIHESFLIECNGELLSVFLGNQGEYVGVYKLTKTKKAWQEVKSLRDKMIFISARASVSVTSGSLRVQGIEDKVYFPRFNGRNGVFYSPATRKFHSFGVGYTGEDLYNTKQQLHCTWIIPTCQLYSDEELEWFSNPEPEKELLSDQQQFSVNLFQKSSFLSNSTCRRGETCMKADKAKQGPRAHPWLVTSHGKHRREQIFFSILEDQCYNRSIPEVSRKEIATCSYGWLVLLDFDSSDCFLFNPLSMEKIQLPPFEESSYHLCVLTSSPNNPNCIVLFCKQDTENEIVVFCRPGDTKWKKQATSRDLKIGDIMHAISYEGNIYGLTRGSYWNFVMININPTLTIRKVTEAIPKTLSRGAKTCCMSLVESCGELFALFKLNFGGKRETVCDIEVFKMNFNQMKWERVESLGDRAFFWSPPCCSSCSASDPKIKGNTIYFTEPEDRSLYAFDLEDGSISVSLPFPNVESDFSQPEWIMCLV